MSIIKSISFICDLADDASKNFNMLHNSKFILFTRHRENTHYGAMNENKMFSFPQQKEDFHSCGTASYSKMVWNDFQNINHLVLNLINSNKSQ